MMSTMLALLLAGHFSCFALASEGGKTSGRFCWYQWCFNIQDDMSNDAILPGYIGILASHTKNMSDLQIARTILMFRMFARVLQDSSLRQFPNVDVFLISEIHVATMSLTCVK